MDKIVTIRTYNDYFSANAMKEVLLESGIQCMVINENSGTVLPALIVGGIKLQVLENDKAKALAIIQNLENEASNDQNTDAF